MANGRTVRAAGRRMRPARPALAALAAGSVMPAAGADGRRPVAEGLHVEGLHVEGPHVDGRRHGPWRIAHPDGSVEEGCDADGRLHGEWTLRGTDGAIVAHEFRCHGRSSGSGKAVCE